MAEVKKGMITTINGSTARVQSLLKTGDVTKPLTIPSYIDTDSLSKGTAVAYTVFEDMTGVIIAVI